MGSSLLAKWEFFFRMEEYLKHSWDPVLPPKQTCDHGFCRYLFISYQIWQSCTASSTHELWVHVESVDFNLVADASRSRGSHFTQLYYQTRERSVTSVRSPLPFTFTLGGVRSILTLCKNKWLIKWVNLRFLLLLHYVKHLVGAHGHFSPPCFLLTVNLLTFVQIVYPLYVFQIILL